GSPPWTPPNPLTVQRRAYALMQGQEDPMPPAQQIGAGRFTLNLLQTIDACLAVSHSSRLSDCTDLMYALNPEVVEPPAVQPQTTSKAPIVAVNRGITTGQKRTPAAASGKGPQNRSYAVWVLVALSLMIVIGIFGYAITRDTAEELFQRGRTSATSPPAATDAPRDTAEELFQRGRTYAEGLGVPQNYREAVRLYRQSADQGNAEAQVSLGNMYSWGRGVSQNDGEAVRLYRQSADQGNAYAQFRLGYMYFWGRGVPQNYREAVRLYRLSADQGNAYAQFRLGYMYFWGRGVPQNDREAVRWYRLSAEKGLGRAQTNLGLMYVNGRGVIRDYIRAYAWLNLAAAAGHVVAAQSRSDVSSMMTAGQIAEAQRLSAELLDAEE
ncbi:MAG: tetratricopeptide repeat protein, partial [Bacteroidota bacterium]|nr:tetratricopeptide repeat protein [Bacteroidota bacterium]